MRKVRIAVMGMMVVVAASLLIGHSGCAAGDAESDAAGRTRQVAVAVRVQPALQEDISRLLKLDGSIEPVRVAQIASPAEGPIQDLQVREGDRVRRGDLLLRIGRSQAAEAAVKAAREQLNQEEQEYQRVQKLVDSGAIPGERLDIAQARLEQARAQWVRAEESRRDHRISAPWDGVVSQVFVRDGAYVTPRTPLAELFDPASLIVQFAVPEESAVATATGAAVEVALDAYPGQPFRAAVSRVYPELDRRTRTRTVEAELIDSAALAPGMFARVSLAVETAHGAVIVPEHAVLTTSDGDHVVFVVEAGKASRRPVQIGIEQGRRVQILVGIQPGEPVVVAGHEKLEEGVPVRVLGTPESGPPAAGAGGR